MKEIEKLVQFQIQCLIEIMADYPHEGFSLSCREFHQSIAQTLRRYLKQSGKWIDEKEVIPDELA